MEPVVEAVPSQHTEPLSAGSTSYVTFQIWNATAIPASATMPRAIISPSVLASDFGQLSAECKRMIKGGAEWLHMGTS